MNPQEILAALEGYQPTEMRSRAAVANALRMAMAGQGPAARVQERAAPPVIPEMPMREDTAIPGLAGLGMAPAKMQERMLPGRFYDQDHIQLENEQPTLEKRPTWYPEDHPDFPSREEKRRGAPTGWNSPTIVQGEGGQDQMAGAEVDDILAQIQGLPPAGEKPEGDETASQEATEPPGHDAAEETPFHSNTKSIAAEATNWLIDNGKISSEDAARAAANLEVPGETVARIGLGQAFLDQYPDFRKNIAAGDASGPVDWIMGQFVDSSKSAAIRRRIASGQDALRRMLTGAALTGNETNEYIARYSPSLTDTNESLLDKTDQLEREIKYIMGALMIGRGGTELLQDLHERLPVTDGRGATNSMESDTSVSEDGWATLPSGKRYRIIK